MSFQTFRKEAYRCEQATQDRGRRPGTARCVWQRARRPTPRTRGPGRRAATEPVLSPESRAPVSKPGRGHLTRRRGPAPWHTGSGTRTRAHTRGHTHAGTHTGARTHRQEHAGTRTRARPRQHTHVDTNTQAHGHAHADSHTRARTHSTHTCGHTHRAHTCGDAHMWARIHTPAHTGTHAPGCTDRHTHTELHGVPAAQRQPAARSKCPFLGLQTYSLARVWNEAVNHPQRTRASLQQRTVLWLKGLGWRRTGSEVTLPRHTPPSLTLCFSTCKKGLMTVTA